MLQLIEANWIAVAAAIAAVLLALRWLIVRARRPVLRSFKPDVLDDGVAPAQRNQALIDATPAVDVAVALPAEVAAAEPVIVVMPEPAPTPSGDDLGRIKGLGPKLKVILEGLGVTSFAQIASWSDADVARIDAQLGAFAGRPARDSWVEQAKLLAAGDVAGFEGRFGKV